MGFLSPPHSLTGSSLNGSIPTELNGATPQHGANTPTVSGDGRPTPRVAAWEEGIRIFNTQLTKDKRKRIALDGLTVLIGKELDRGPRVAIAPSQCQSPLQQLVKTTKDAIQRCEESKGRVRKKLETILSTIDKYASSIDVLIQQHPDTTALVWGAIRMLVTVAVNDQNTSDRLSSALADIVDNIGRCEDYQILYPHAKRLETIISKLYAESINFLVRSKHFFEMNKTLRLAKSSVSPFETRFGSILERIEKLRQEVRDEVQLLSVEAQAEDRSAQAKLSQDLLQYFEKAKHRWYIEERIQQASAAEQHEQTLRNLRIWLDPTHFDHLRREKCWQEGTCQWITAKGTFQCWRDQSSGTLWIYGIPGCGKTVMASYLIDLLTGEGRPVIHFFCKNDDESKRRPPFVIATLIAQLLDHPRLEDYQDNISQLIKRVSDRNPDMSKMSMDRLCRLLGDILGLLPPISIILDALDECEPEGLSRSFFVEKFLGFSKSIPGTMLIFTSRHQEPFFEMLEPCLKVEMSKEDLASDIEAVVRKVVDESPKLRVLREKIIAGLLAGADGMFLWAELMLSSLKRARNRNAVQRMLANLPVGLRGVYEHILISTGKALSEDDLTLRKDILSWVTTAIRPMTVEELSLALAVEIGTIELDEGEIILRLENDIQDLCGPMLKILGDRTVQIVHMSVKDVLHAPPHTSNSLGQDQRYLISFNPEMEHARLASSCITYLSFEQFGQPKWEDQLLSLQTDLAPLVEEHVLLNYSTLYWVQHLTRSGDFGTNHVDLMLKLLQSKNTYSWIQFLSFFTGREPQNFSYHILLRSNLTEWVQKHGATDNVRTRQILDGYLIQAIRTGLDLCERKFGNGHPQSLDALNRLGCLYDHEDRIEDAALIQQKIADLTRSATDSKARELYRRACIELASLYRLKSDYVKSIQILEDVLGGPDPSKWAYDRMGAEAMADLGVVLRKQGDLEKSREVAERGAEGLTAILGPNHLMTIRYMIELCRTYFELQLFDKSQALLKKTLEIADDSIGSEESTTLHGRALLGQILQARGELMEAEKLLREVLRLMRQQWGENGRSTARLKILLADVLVEKEQLKEAAEFYKGALGTYESLLGNSHPDTMEANAKLIDCLTQGHIECPEGKDGCRSIVMQGGRSDEQTD